MFRHEVNCVKKKGMNSSGSSAERDLVKGLSYVKGDGCYVCFKCQDKLSGSEGRAGWKGLTWRGCRASVMHSLSSWSYLGAIFQDPGRSFFSVIFFFFFFF